MNKYVIAMIASLTAHSSQAQTTYLSDRRRFYIGLELAEGNYEIFYANPHTIPNVVNASSPFVLGYYLTSRLAVQVGYGYDSGIFESPGDEMTDTSGQHFLFNIIHEDYGTHVVPLTLRYALSRRRPRLRADILLGTAYVYSWYNYMGYNKVNGQVYGELNRHDYASQFYVTGGLDARWVFNRHFEAIGTYTLTRNLKNVTADIHQLATGNRLGLTRSFSLGVLYRFNLRKPTAAAPAVP